jgi:hypothetical protein
MDPRKIVVTAGLVTFTLSSVPHIPPPQPSSNVTFTLSRGKFTLIESDKRKKDGETAHTHLLHAVGTFFATDSSTVIGASLLRTTPSSSQALSVIKSLTN